MTAIYDHLLDAKQKARFQLVRSYRDPTEYECVDCQWWYNHTNRIMWKQTEHGWEKD